MGDTPFDQNAAEIIEKIKRRRARNSRKSPKRGQLLRWKERLKELQDNLAAANAEIARLRQIRRQAYRWAHDILEATGTGED